MGKPTADAAVYEALLRKLLARELRPGEHVVVAVLAEELGVSPTPIRAAMERLVAEGLFVKHNHRGCFVAKCARSELDALKRAREIIEGGAAALTAATNDPGAISELRRAYEAMEDAVKRGDLHTYLWTESEFHQQLLRGCGNRFISGLGGAANLGLLGWVNVDPWPEGDVDITPGSAFWSDRSTSLRRHALILEAIEAGDPIAAAEAVRRDIAGINPATMPDSG